MDIKVYGRWARDLPSVGQPARSGLPEAETVWRDEPDLSMLTYDLVTYDLVTYGPLS